MIMVIVTVLNNALLVIGDILGGWVGFVNENGGFHIQASGLFFNSSLSTENGESSESVL